MILALGGSKRTRNPKNVMSVSSALLISDADPIFLYARPRVRKPLLLSFSKCCWIWFRTTALQEIRAIARVRCLASSLLNPSLAVPRCWSITVAEMHQKAEGSWFIELLNWQAYFRKCCRTFAAIWRSVILSTVSIPTMRPPKPLFARRFSSSPFASPGPNSRMDSESRSCAITAS